MLPIIPLPLIDHLFSKFVALPVASLDSDACELLHTLTRVALSHQELVSSSPTTSEAVAEATSAATHQQNALERRSYGLAIFWRVLQDGSGAADDLALEAMRHLYELFQHQICTSLRYAIAADELLHSSLLIAHCCVRVSLDRLPYVELCIANIASHQTALRSIELLREILGTINVGPQPTQAHTSVPATDIGSVRVSRAISYRQAPNVALLDD